MKRKEPVAMYVCPKCDREYYSAPRSTWEDDREGNHAKAKVAKRAHKCPWELRRERRKNK